MMAPTRYAGTPSQGRGLGAEHCSEQDQITHTAAICSLIHNVQALILIPPKKPHFLSIPQELINKIFLDLDPTPLLELLQASKACCTLVLQEVLRRAGMQNDNPVTVSLNEDFKALPHFFCLRDSRDATRIHISVLFAFFNQDTVDADHQMILTSCFWTSAKQALPSGATIALQYEIRAPLHRGFLKLMQAQHSTGLCQIMIFGLAQGTMPKVNLNQAQVDLLHGLFPPVVYMFVNQKAFKEGRLLDAVVHSSSVKEITIRSLYNNSWEEHSAFQGSNLQLCKMVFNGGPHLSLSHFLAGCPQLNTLFVHSLGDTLPGFPYNVWDGVLPLPALNTLQSDTSVVARFFTNMFAPNLKTMDLKFCLPQLTHCLVTFFTNPILHTSLHKMCFRLPEIMEGLVALLEKWDPERRMEGSLVRYLKFICATSEPILLPDLVCRPFISY